MVHIMCLIRLHTGGRFKVSGAAVAAWNVPTRSPLRDESVGVGAQLREDLFEGPDEVVLFDFALPEGQRQAVGLVRRPELEGVRLAPALVSRCLAAPAPQV